MMPHRYADEHLARQYVAFLIGATEYEAAARAWAAYLDGHRNGYLESTWVFNGDFETEPSGVGFDWTIEPMAGVQVAWDSSVAHTGSHSMRIHFDGNQNVDYHHFLQNAFLPPGTYRLEAFIRTRDITTSQGVGLAVFDAELSSRLQAKTESLTGTNDWKKVEQTFRVTSQTKLALIAVVRAAVVFKFDDKISGTAWIDSVKLSKLP